MKLFILVLLLISFELSSIIFASPPKGGIGDGYIYPVKNSPSKPKSTTYYAKPIHSTARKHTGPSSKPKSKVYKVIIQNQGSQPQKQEQIFKVIRLSKNDNANNRNGGHGGKSVTVLKVIHLQQPKGGHGGSDWS